MGSQKTVCCRLFAEMGKPSVFVQKAQMIVWPGNLHFRIPGQTQLMLAQKSCMMRLPWFLPHLLTQPMLHQPLSRHTAMVHTVVHTRQELKLSMLPMGRLMLYPTSTHMQDFMDSSLPTKSSFVSGIETVTVTWRWACWLEQPQAWP
uniref:Pleckstrin homology domain containing B2 n=1 Tax=Balaenoptera musculus TaxID=9771 RepID=A0A8C0CS54_BALMU